MRRRAKKIGLAMGGGGARGLAHIGVLKVLEQESIPIDILVGTSIGALVGGAYASDLNPFEMEKKVLEFFDSSEFKSSSIRAIEADRELSEIFAGIRSAGHSLKEVAKHLGLGVIEITQANARTPGILARSSTLLAEKGIIIRQAIVDDPELSPEPKLTIIANTKIPGELIPKFLKIRGVEKVSVY